MKPIYIYDKEMGFACLSEMITKYALHDLFISLYEAEIQEEFLEETEWSSMEDYVKENIESLCNDVSDHYGEYETIEYMCRSLLDAGESFELVESEVYDSYTVTYYKLVPTSKEDCIAVGVQLLTSLPDFNVTIDDIKKEYLKQKLLKGGKDE